jgi:hypothetical protein
MPNYGASTLLGIAEWPATQSPCSKMGDWSLITLYHLLAAFAMADARKQVRTMIMASGQVKMALLSSSWSCALKVSLPKVGSIGQYL